MSKSKGNVVDPLELCDKYGTDAVRFALARMGAPGTDIALSDDLLESYRDFATKIWNAARFIFRYVEDGDRLPTVAELKQTDLSLADRWILVAPVARGAGSQHVARAVQPARRRRGRSIGSSGTSSATGIWR